MLSLVALILITLLVLLLNLVLHDYDMFHPACVLALVFFAAEFVCLLCVKTYMIEFHWKTTLIVAVGLTVFAVVGMLADRIDAGSPSCDTDGVRVIELSNVLVGSLAVLYAVALLFFIKYLNNIADVYNEYYHYNGYVHTLTEKIKLFDTLNKFWQDTFNKMSVPIPMIYRVLNPICYSCSWLVLYVAVNNFVAARKINILQMIVLLELCIHIVMNGSRSPLFRVLTMGIVLFYIFRYRSGGKEAFKLNAERRKFWVTVFIIMCFAAVAFVLMLFVTGRFDEDNFNPAEYFFIYVGAPLVNLDNYYAGHDIVVHNTGVFGQQTFQALYAYISKIFHVDLTSNIENFGFAFSNNGIEIGNVYTTFMPFVYDYGMWGVAPLMGVIAYYYNRSYHKISAIRSSSVKIDYRIFMYAFLFNDLIMLIFSNRFFSTIGEGVFIKMLIITYLADKVLIEKSVRVGSFVFVKDDADVYIKRIMSFVPLRFTNSDTNIRFLPIIHTYEVEK